MALLVIVGTVLVVLMTTSEVFTAVRSGRAVAASPGSVVSALPWSDLVARPVDGLAPATLAACHRRGDGRPVVEAFVRSALAAVGRHQAPG